MSTRSAGRIGADDDALRALRELVRTGHGARAALAHARRRVLRLLDLHGRAPAAGEEPWSPAFLRWLAHQRFEQLAVQVVFADAVEEVLRAAGRAERLDRALDDVWARSGAPRSLRRRGRRSRGPTVP